jgi:hypothetical protein
MMLGTLSPRAGVCKRGVGLWLTVSAYCFSELNARTSKAGCEALS